MLIQLLFVIFIKIVVGDSVVRINNTKGFIDFSKNVNSGNNYSRTTVYLDSDLSLFGGTLGPVGNRSKYFIGVFDGQGHTISDLKINSSSQYAGLFGYSTGLTAKNVVLDSSCSIAGSGSFYIGGINGWCESKSGPCIIENIVNMARVSFSGSISYDLHIGGIVGVGGASDSYNVTVKNCVNYGDVVHEGTVKGYCDIGGIVGHYINGLKYIKNCINYGTIYHSGTTSGDKYIGGIVGYAKYDGSTSASGETIIENCLCAGEVKSNNDTLYFKGSIVGNVNSTTSITHCFWSNDTGCDTAYGTSNTNVTIANSSSAELDADLLAVMIEYAKQNTNTSTSSLGEYHVLHLNGGRINSTAQDTLLVTQRRFPTPLKEDTAFLLWCGDISCNVTYNASDSSASDMVDVYAIWNTSTVTFDFMNGSDSFVNDTFQFNTNITYPEDVVREGYTHSGWEPAYSLMPGTDVTLYAQWTPNNYTVTFDVNGGNKPSISTVTIIFNSSYGNLPDASRDGHTFIGWFTDKNESVKNETTVSIADNHILHAQWEEVTNYVEIVFSAKNLSREDIEELVKKYTDAEFTITEFGEESGEIRVIIKFIDNEDAKNFVETIRESSEMGGVKKINFDPNNDASSFSQMLSPIMFFNIILLSFNFLL